MPHLKLYTLKPFYHPYSPTWLTRWINEYREKKWNEQREFIKKIAHSCAYESANTVCKELYVGISLKTMQAFLDKAKANREAVGHNDWPTLGEILIQSRRETSDYRCKHAYGEEV